MKAEEMKKIIGILGWVLFGIVLFALFPILLFIGFFVSGFSGASGINENGQESEGGP